jgi:hypothetical protein
MNDAKRKQLVDALVDAAIGDKGIRAQYQKALGSLAINFSLLHFELEMFSWDVFEVDHQTGQILTKDLPTSKLIQKLRACCDRRAIQPTVRTQVSKLLKQVEKAADRRNELLHSLWFLHQGQPAFCYQRGSRQGKVHSAPTASEISDFASSIETLIGALLDLKKTASISLSSFADEGHPDRIIPRQA